MLPETAVAVLALAALRVLVRVFQQRIIATVRECGDISTLYNTHSFSGISMRYFAPRLGRIGARVIARRLWRVQLALLVVVPLLLATSLARSLGAWQAPSTFSRTPGTGSR